MLNEIDKLYASLLGIRPWKLIILVRAGVPADEIERIFERFYKVDKSRGLDTKSTGLGLYIVKSIIEMHGGTIEASSELNKYTLFRFTLPND